MGAWERSAEREAGAYQYHGTSSVRVPISVLRVLIAISGLGCFDPECDDGILYHSATRHSILPYTIVGPYCLLLAAVGFSLGGLIVGSTTVFIIHKAKVDWFNEVRYPFVLCSQDDTRRTVYYRLSNGVSLIRADGGTKQTMMGSRPRIWVTMILLSFPFMSIGISTCAAAAGECL